MKMLPITLTKSALEAIGREPDEPRMRFIGSALEAARLAMEMDAPHHEIEPRLKALISMIKASLDDWVLIDLQR